MPDITQCCNRDCPLRDKCYRYRAIPDDYQSFAFFEPEYRFIKRTNSKVPECSYFWELDVRADRFLPTDIVDNRYDRDEKWKGLK